MRKRAPYTFITTELSSLLCNRILALPSAIKELLVVCDQVLTLGLERESERRLEELKRNNSVSQSQEFYLDNGDGQADYGSVVPQQQQ